MSKKEPSIGIISIKDDFHALVIQKTFESIYNIDCHIIETDALCGSSSLSWLNTDEHQYDSFLLDSSGNLINVSDLSLLWWRRFSRNQLIPASIIDTRHIDLIHHDCEKSLLGLLQDSFSGTWISHPAKTRLAESKIIQIRAAHKAGFRVPKTLVSQNPSAIREFCELLNHKVVIKPVRGTVEVPLFAKMVTQEHLICDQSLRLCPAIYQEYIPGKKHLRIHCFGEDIYPVLIESEKLDWRGDLNIPFSSITLNKKIENRLLHVLEILDLKMGIFDLKLDLEDNPIWLEVNPQGQFLFSEGLSGVDLTTAFSSFLYKELVQHHPSMISN